MSVKNDINVCGNGKKYLLTNEEEDLSSFKLFISQDLKRESDLLITRQNWTSPVTN